jgi:hypothetical protein
MEMDDKVLRTELVNLLTQEQAHVQFEAALAGVKRANRNRAVPGGVHTLWELLEHVRICQEDILRYTLDAAWRSPETMEEYWPKPVAGEIDDAAWDRSVKAFFRDRDDVVRMAQDRARDLTVKIPHGESRTYLRQVLLVADHNAYHLAQIVQARKALGDWPSA